MKKFTLSTERLTLKLVTTADVPRMYEMLTMYPELSKFVTFDTPTDISQTEDFVNFVNKPDGNDYCWGIFSQPSLKKSAEKSFGRQAAENLIGVVGIDSIKRKNPTGAWRLDQASLGYWLSPEFHGQGIMSEATRAVVAFGFEHLDLHKLIADHIYENEPSRRIIEKLGFRCIGVKHQEAFFDEKWWDLVHYELLRGDRNCSS